MILSAIRAPENARKPRVGFEWLAAVACLSLLVAPFGCQIQQQIDNPTDNSADKTSTGLFLNENIADSAIIAGRSEAGDTLFVYGTRTSSGGLGEVDSILVRSAAGDESFVLFESGRPVHAEGPDGSFVNVDYSSVGATMLTAIVNVFDAGSGQTNSYDVDIDLQRAVSQVADEVAQRTGQHIQIIDPATIATGKAVSRSDTKITIFSPLLTILVLPFVAIVTLMNLVLGQILTILYAVVIATIQAALVLALAPVFLIGALLGDTIVNIRLLSFGDVFDSEPDPPVIR